MYKNPIIYQYLNDKILSFYPQSQNFIEEKQKELLSQLLQLITIQSNDLKINQCSINPNTNNNFYSSTNQSSQGFFNATFIDNFLQIASSVDSFQQFYDKFESSLKYLLKKRNHLKIINQNKSKYQKNNQYYSLNIRQKNKKCNMLFQMIISNNFGIHTVSNQIPQILIILKKTKQGILIIGYEKIQIFIHQIKEKSLRTINISAKEQNGNIQQQIYIHENANDLLTNLGQNYQNLQLNKKGNQRFNIKLSISEEEQGIQLIKDIPILDFSNNCKTSSKQNQEQKLKQIWIQCSLVKLKQKRQTIQQFLEEQIQQFQGIQSDQSMKLKKFLKDLQQFSKIDENQVLKLYRDLQDSLQKLFESKPQHLLPPHFVTYYFQKQKIMHFKYFVMNRYMFFHQQKSNISSCLRQSFVNIKFGAIAAQIKQLYHDYLYKKCQNNPTIRIKWTGKFIITLEEQEQNQELQRFVNNVCIIINYHLSNISNLQVSWIYKFKTLEDIKVLQE